MPSTFPWPGQLHLLFSEENSGIPLVLVLRLLAFTSSPNMDLGLGLLPSEALAVCTSVQKLLSSSLILIIPPHLTYS